MSFMTSDMIECFINDGYIPLGIDNAGPLYAPIRDLKIKRDDKLRLILTTTSDPISESNRIDHPPGTIRINNDTIELSSIPGTKIRMNGIQPFSQNTSHDNNGHSVCTERSSLDSAEVTIKDASTGNYLVEWLENVDDGHYIWPSTNWRLLFLAFRAVIRIQRKEPFQPTIAPIS